VRSWRFVVNGDLKLGIGLLMFKSLFLRYVVIDLAQRYDSKSSRVGKPPLPPRLIMWKTSTWSRQRPSEPIARLCRRRE
jgi:hypothetical protein